MYVYIYICFQHYLHHIYHIAPIGFVLSLLRFTDANLFLVLYIYIYIIYIFIDI